MGDAGLAELGVPQARERGRALAGVVQDGEGIALLPAPTERPRRTVECIRQELLAPSSPAGVGEIRRDPDFADVTVWVDGRAHEPTQGQTISVLFMAAAARSAR